jgi:hypothetical protein
MDDLQTVRLVHSALDITRYTNCSIVNACVKALISIRSREMN